MADLFETDPKEISIDPEKNYLEELVGDGKKFKTPADLAKGKAESDLFIKRLLKEQEELREELKNKVTTEQILDQIKALKTPIQTPEEDTTHQEERKGLTQEELEALLDRRLTEKERERAQVSNLDFVKGKLVEKFGSEELVQAEIAAKARELDIQPEMLKQMALQTPKVFLSLFSETKQVDVAPPRSSVATRSSSGGVRNQTYWQELRRKNPTAYHSKELTIERHNDAIKLGEAFFT